VGFVVTEEFAEDLLVLVELSAQVIDTAVQPFFAFGFFPCNKKSYIFTI
jgi:hypothetical protein